MKTIKSQDMKKYYVINEIGNKAVCKANFNQIHDANGVVRCNRVWITTILDKKRGFVKREKAEVVAKKATEYCEEKFMVVCNQD